MQLIRLVIKHVLIFTFCFYSTKLYDSSGWCQREGNIVNLDDTLWLAFVKAEDDTTGVEHE